MVEDNHANSFAFRRRAGGRKGRVKRRVADSEGDVDKDCNALAASDSKKSVEPLEERLLLGSRRRNRASSYCVDDDEDAHTDRSPQSPYLKDGNISPLVVGPDDRQEYVDYNIVDEGVDTCPTETRQLASSWGNLSTGKFLEKNMGAIDNECNGDGKVRDYSPYSLDRLGGATAPVADGNESDGIESWMHAVGGHSSEKDGENQVDTVRSPLASGKEKVRRARRGVCEDRANASRDGEGEPEFPPARLFSPRQTRIDAFVPLESGAQCSSRVGHLDGFAPLQEGDSSGGSEWERELLKRAGLGNDTGFDTHMASSRARTVIEEEGGYRGSRGEVGTSVAETCYENVAARENAAKERVLRLQADLDAIDVAESRGATEFSVVERDERLAKTRSVYYSDLLQYLRDIAEMLSESSEEAVQNLNTEMEDLRRLSIERTSLLDEFGRAKRSTLLLDGNGDETLPNAARNTSFRRRTSESGGMELSDLEASAPESLEVESLGPLADVADQFKSIPCIVGRFTEWQTQFPLDYEAAYGDISLGKLCGAVALASGASADTAWLDLLPEGAVGPAIIKSRAAPWAALQVAGRWEPLCSSSSEYFAECIRNICSGLKSHRAEFRLACGSFHRALLDVLKWRVNSIKEAQVSSQAPADMIRVCRAAGECARGASTVASALGEAGFSMSAVEACVSSELLTKVICAELRLLTSSESSIQIMRAACSTLLFAVDGLFPMRSRGGMGVSVKSGGFSALRSLLVQMRSEEGLLEYHHDIDAHIVRVGQI